MKRPLALDANVLLRTTLRTWFSALAEAAGRTVLIPETARVHACEHYGRATKGTLKRRIEQEVLKQIEQGKPPPTEEQIQQVWMKRVVTVAEVWDRWLEHETGTNDAGWRMAPRTRRTHEIATELAILGIVDDENDQRYGTGEDAQVTAEALSAGAVRITTDNRARIHRSRLDDWIAAKGLDTARPFIVNLHDASLWLLNETTPKDVPKDHLGATRGGQALLVLHATFGRSTPAPREAMDQIGRVTDHLAAGGLHEIAEDAKEAASRLWRLANGDPERCLVVLAKQAEHAGIAPHRTRDRERRRIRYERDHARQHPLPEGIPPSA